MSIRRNRYFHLLLCAAWAAFCWFPAEALAQYVQDGGFETVPGESWALCSGEPDRQVLDGNGPGIFGIHTPPAQGQYYLGLVATDGGIQEAIGQRLFLEAGRHCYGSISLFRSTAHQNWDGTGSLEIWGGSDCNDVTELLWTSGTISNIEAWRAYPVFFSPIENHTWISLRLSIDPGSGTMTYVCLDDFRLDNVFFSVNFLDVKAQAVPQGIQLDWTTASLPDATEFEVQWSNDGKTFQGIAQQSAPMGGTGFSCSHANTAPGRHFYRIAATDAGGHTDISPVVEALIASPAATVFPNPVRDHFTAMVPDGQELKSLRLMDLQGRVVLERKGDESPDMRVSLPEGIAPGVYVLEISSGQQTFRQSLRVDGI